MRKTIYLITISLLLMCCRSEKRKINVTDDSLYIKIQRFDKDFWLQDTNHLDLSMQNLHKKYPILLPLYMERALTLGAWNNTGNQEVLKMYFFPDSTIQQLYGDCLKQYNDISDIEKKLTEAFRRGHAFFPEKVIPEISFHVSAGANPEVLLFKDSLISLSIDNYLGSDYFLYKNTVFDYMKINMRREKVASDIVTVWITLNFPFHPQSGQLLDEMLYRGKIMYALSVLMPDEKEWNLMGYPQQKWKWCINQEQDMWMSMIENKHLFSTEGLLITKYLNDAPFTSFFSQESPGRCGVFIGWRIIESYMEHNQNITLFQLMEDTNYKSILEKSYYKP